MLEKIQVTENINLGELIAKETLDNLQDLANRLQKFRTWLGKPIYINTPAAQLRGLRTAGQNEAAGGATRSQHLEGKAADISWAGFVQGDSEAHAELKNFFNCIIWYPAHVHIDTRPWEFIDFNGKYK